MRVPFPVLGGHARRRGLARRGMVAALAFVLVVMALPICGWAQTGGAADASVLPAIGAAPAQGVVDINEGLGWTVISGLLVMFMQLGFGMEVAGLTRSKNSATTFAMTMMIVPLLSLAFFAYGFATGWGNSHIGGLVGGWSPGGWGVLGTQGYFLSGVGSAKALALFALMMVFMNTAAMIPIGGMCERWRWGNFCLYGMWAAIPCCVFAHWAWGGGWLAQLGAKTSSLGHGFVDYGGSGVVHLMGGVMALAGTLVMGPRIGKFINMRPSPLPGHSLPMAMGGTFILAFGWLGFNPGATLAGGDMRISFIVNAFLAAAGSAVSSMVIIMLKFKKPDPSIMANGVLAGLAAISAAAPFVSPAGAVIIGLLAGAVVVQSIFFWDRMGIDDPTGALSVHGVCGLLGVFAVGLFATGEHGGGWNGVTRAGAAKGVLGIMPIGASGGTWFSNEAWGQLGAQGLGGVTCIVFGLLVAYVMFRISNLVHPVRVSREVELQGCDIPEAGAMAYPEFEINTNLSVSGIVSAYPMRQMAE